MSWAWNCAQTRTPAKALGVGGENHFFFVHQNPLPYSGQVATPTDLSCFRWVRNVFLPFIKLLLSPSPLHCVKGKTIKIKRKKKGRVKIHLQNLLQLFQTFPAFVSKPPSRWESRGSLFVCFGLARNSQSVACYCLACSSPHGRLPWAMLWSLAAGSQPLSTSPDAQITPKVSRRDYCALLSLAEHASNYFSWALFSPPRLQ